MAHDYLGNPLSDADPAVVQAIDDFVGGFLGYEPRMLGVLAAADGAVDSCLANAYAGWLWMFLESLEAPPKARAYLTRAEAAAAGATPRERLAARLLRHWMEDDIDGATRVADEILRIAPRDLAVVKLHQYLNFNRGQSPQMLRVALQALPHADDVPQMHGMLAFAYEQCHLLEEAESCARQALLRLPSEPWAQHALAHVLLTRGHVDDGIALLEPASAGWEGLTSFMYTHNWWHLAVFYISCGRFEEALAIYDQHCWARDRSFSQDQIGAVSLLARLELAGVDVGTRWPSVAEHVAARGPDTAQPFLALQYLYGLRRAGRAEADAMRLAIRARASAAPTATRSVWHDVAEPTAAALDAYLAGRWDEALSTLGPALGRMLEIGGSHAQRDLFALIHLDALVRGRHLTAAQQCLEQRRHIEPDGIPLNAALASVYAALGLEELSARAAERAARRGVRAPAGSRGTP